MRNAVILAMLLALSLVAQVDLRVQVVYGNEETFVGVAKGGQLAEVMRGGRYVPVEDRKTAGAGLRLWYWQNEDGFLFLEHARIRELKVLGPLSNEDAAAVAKVAPKPRVIPKSQTKAPESRPASTPAPASRPADSAKDPLLVEFPPEEGWNPDRFGEIQRRRIVLHISPTQKEQEFVDKFEQFREAYLKAEAEKAEKAQKTKP